MYDYYVPNALPTTYLRADQGFERDGIRYAPGWLRLASAEDRAALGIEPAIIGPRPDERYYWVSEVRVGNTVSYVGAPKDLIALKAEAIGRIKAQAAGILAPTDWKVLRTIERGDVLDAAFKNWRQAVRDASSAAEAAIDACATVEELAALAAPTWPEA
jgi:hypothetical protein